MLQIRDWFFLFLIIILIILSTSLAYYLNGVKILTGVGIGMQILGFVIMLINQQSFSIKDHELFNKIFNVRRNEPVVQGGYASGAVIGLWIVLMGLTFQLITLYLV